MSSEIQESANATMFRLVRAISEVDCGALQEIAAENIELRIPGARDVDMTQSSTGPKALCRWAQTVRQECGLTTFKLHRYFENGCELMATGTIEIERNPRRFESPCSLHVRIEQGRVASFQLLFDTYSLEKFRGQMD